MSINLRTSDIVIVCGRIESGKSTLLKKLIRPLPKKVIWDYNFEHSYRGCVVHYADQLPENFNKFRTVVYQPRHKRDRDFVEFIEKVRHFWNFTLVIEEAERFARGGKHDFIPEGLEDMVDTGVHHKSQGIYVTCRRIGDLHRKLFYNVHHLFAFEVTRPEDVDYLRKALGQKAYMLNAETARKHGLEPLPPYFFLHYDRKRTVVREKVSP